MTCNCIKTALKETTRPMMYKMHKWPGRKPINVWAEWIKSCSKPGDIVFDPFCGSGVAVLESVLLGRKGFGIDLNPMSIFMTRSTSLLKSDEAFIKKLEKEWQKLKQDLREFENQTQLYTTECSGDFNPNCSKRSPKPVCQKCGRQARIFNFRHENKYDLKQIAYQCVCTPKNNHPLCDNRDCWCLKKDADAQDILKKDNFEVLQKNFVVCERMNCWYWHPTTELPNTKEGNGIRRQYGGDTYAILHPKHALFCMSYIFFKINQIEDTKIRNLFVFAFTSMVHLLTKVPVTRDADETCRECSVSMGRLTFMLAEDRVEPNPIMQFERAIEEKQGLLEAIKSANNRTKNKNFLLAKNPKQFLNKKSNTNFLLGKINVLDLFNHLPENSVDYVLTDPPYAGLVPYFDISAMWTEWLKGIEQNVFFDMNFNQELTEDNARNFDLAYFQRNLTLSFKEVFRVLKPDKLMTVTFHGPRIEVYKTLITACKTAGFEMLEYPIWQENARAGETGVSNPKGTAVSDYYFCFKKPKIKSKKHKITEFQKYVIRTIPLILTEKFGKPATLIDILPYFVERSRKDGYFLDFESDEQVEKILEKHGKDCKKISTNVNNKQQDYWWLSDNFIIKHRLTLIPLEDRISKIILDLLRRKGSAGIDEIFASIYTKFPDELTPDANIQSALSVLADYNESTEKWQLNPIEDQIEASRPKDHTRKEIILAKIGKKLGYDIWCPKGDRKGNELQKLCLKDFPFPNLPLADKIKEIDVLWIDSKNKKITYAMDVEHSTAITSALNRCSNLPDQTTQKIIVVPEHRKNFLKSLMRNILFNKVYTDDKWKKIWFSDLDNLDPNLKRSELLKKFKAIMK